MYAHLCSPKKSFRYADLEHKKQFLLLSMLKTVVRSNIFVESVTFEEYEVQKNSIYLKQNLLVRM